MFMGEYHHTLDEKGRLTLPSKIRTELGETFIITRGMDDCLFVYPKEEWLTVTRELKNLPNTSSARNYMRFLLSGAIECTFDKQGRINLPDPLITYASLIKECIIIGVDTRLEIWSKDTWMKFIEQNESNFSQIADELFAPNIHA